MLGLLRGFREDVARVDAQIDEAKAELKSEIQSLRADGAYDLLRLETETREQIVGLRQTIADCHSSVIGHGNLISDLEARMRRAEQHLNLPPMDVH